MYSPKWWLRGLPEVTLRESEGLCFIDTRVHEISESPLLPDMYTFWHRKEVSWSVCEEKSGLKREERRTVDLIQFLPVHRSSHSKKITFDPYSLFPTEDDSGPESSPPRVRTTPLFLSLSVRVTRQPYTVNRIYRVYLEVALRFFLYSTFIVSVICKRLVHTV